MAEQDLIQSRSQHSALDLGAAPLTYLRRLGPRARALGFLLALLLAEALTTLVEPRLGMFMHGLLFILLLLYASLSSRGLFQKFLFALAMAPLIRLLSLTMPLVGFPFVFWYMVVGAPLFLAVYSLSKLARLRRAHLGLNLRFPVWQLLISLTGIGFGLIEYYILRPKPLIEQLTWRNLMLPAFILLVFTGFLEELIFRGVLQYTALRRFGRFGLWYVATVFAVLHLGYRSVLDVVFVFVVAVFFGWVVMKTGSIVGVTLSHGLTNISLYLVIPFLLASPPSVSYSVPQEILAPLPTRAENTPFQPLLTATFPAIPVYTSTAPAPTSLPSTQTQLPPTTTESPTDTPPPPPTVPIYYFTSLPPLPSPTATALSPSLTPTIAMPTADPAPPSSVPSLAPTSTLTPLPSRTPENTPTIVDLPTTPTETPLDPASTSTEATLPPTPTIQPTSATRIAPPPPGIP